MNRFNSILQTANNKNSELEDDSIEIIQTEAERRENFKKLRGMRDTAQSLHLFVVFVVLQGQTIMD